MTNTDKAPSERPARVSVFHMTYNQVEGLRQGVEASLAQDYPNLEIVFSDDHSTDGTFEHLQEIVAEYTGPHDVRVLRNPVNVGIVGNVNSCIEKTEGDLIVQTNGDDVSVPDRVSKLVQKWQSAPDVMLVHSTSRYLSLDGVLGEYCNTRPEAHYRNSPVSYIMDGYYALGASAAYDRRIFEHFGPLSDVAVVEDCIIPLRARVLGQVLKVDEVLVWLRPGGVSDGNDEKRKLEMASYVAARRATNALAIIQDLKLVSFPGKQSALLACRMRLWEANLRRAGLERILTRVRPTLRRVLRPLIHSFTSRT